MFVECVLRSRRSEIIMNQTANLVSRSTESNRADSAQSAEGKAPRGEGGRTVCSAEPAVSPAGTLMTSALRWEVGERLRVSRELVGCRGHLGVPLGRRALHHAQATAGRPPPSRIPAQRRPRGGALGAPRAGNLGSTGNTLPEWGLWPCAPASEGGPDICHTPFTRGGSGRPALVCHVSVSALHVAGKLRKAPDPARLGEGRGRMRGCWRRQP